MAKIAVDCDGVLADFIAGAVEIINRMFPGKLPKDYVHTTWAFLALSRPEWSAVMDEIKRTPNWWLTLKAFPENVGALERFMVANAGHDLWVVTARYPNEGMTVAKQTQLWIDACGIREHHNFLSTITVDDPEGKAPIYKAMGVQYSIDDKAETVIQCQSLPNHRAALLDRPWNESYDVLWRVPSLAAFLDAVGQQSR
jgi:5'(3')-deoxyribonucleotidase